MPVGGCTVGAFEAGIGGGVGGMTGASVGGTTGVSVGGTTGASVGGTTGGVGVGAGVPGVGGGVMEPVSRRRFQYFLSSLNREADPTFFSCSDEPKPEDVESAATANASKLNFMIRFLTSDFVSKHDEEYH
jgi:hypothetical protein